MDEIERQLRDLAAHRAAQVPAFDTTALTAPAGPRRPPLPAVLAIAALVIALLVGGGFLLFSDDDADHARVIAPPSSSSPVASTSAATTAPPATTMPPAPTCPNVEGTGTTPVSGGTKLGADPQPLYGVFAQAGACLDRITFRIAGSGWDVRYEDGPFRFERAEPMRAIRGAAFLVVRFDHAASEWSQNPVEFLPAAPSVIAEVALLANSGGNQTWVVGLKSRLPFKVVSGAELSEGFAIDLPAAAPRPMLCASGERHFQVHVPHGWFVEVGPTPCSKFASEPFALYLDSNWHLVFAGVGTARFPDTISLFETIVGTREFAVDGRPAIAVETAAGPEAPSVLIPDEYHRYSVEIDWGAEGVFRVSGFGSPGQDLDEVKARIDEIANSARFVP